MHYAITVATFSTRRMKNNIFKSYDRHCQHLTSGRIAQTFIQPRWNSENVLITQTDGLQIRWIISDREKCCLEVRWKQRVPQWHPFLQMKAHGAAVWSLIGAEIVGKFLCKRVDDVIEGVYQCLYCVHVRITCKSSIKPCICSQTHPVCDNHQHAAFVCAVMQYFL